MIDNLLFITGTGTDIGKTYVTGLLAKSLTQQGLKVAYFKAAMSGNPMDSSGRPIPGDARFVTQFAGLQQDEQSCCPYVYHHSYSPHLAASIEGEPVDKKLVLSRVDQLCRHYDLVLMEGAGGIICPLRNDEPHSFDQQDLISELNAPCLIVAPIGLGVINALTLTKFYMSHQQIRTLGVVYNHFDPTNEMHLDNLRQCEMRTGLPSWGNIEQHQTHWPISAQFVMEQVQGGVS